MTFTLTITCDNAAFGNDFDGNVDTVTASNEVTRILSETITKLRAGDSEDGSCYDSNGSRVGGYSFRD